MKALSDYTETITLDKKGRLHGVDEHEPNEREANSSCFARVRRVGRSNEFFEGFVVVHENGRRLWSKGSGIWSLTKEDARADAQRLADTLREGIAI